MDLDLIKEEDLIDGPSYLFCLHPHGVLGYSHYANFMSTYSKFYSLFPKISLRTCTINLNFKVPFARESFVLRGFISADKESINFSLNKKNNDASKINAVAIVIGGAKESELAIPNRNTLVLKNRKGFVKIAIQNGSSLVPVYSFQENNLYKQIENKTIKKIQNLFQKYTTFRPVLVYGRFGTLIPFRTKIVTVVGKPIKVAKNPNPTEEEINKYHKQYILGVREIFDKYKDLYAKDRTEDLIII
ncbi:diacylglycerol O-acyltransferase 1 [Lobulomyces angularis]|nr:diacylglycerol O-acyltransferase 1 [Lobulomyces angularis]